MYWCVIFVDDACKPILYLLTQGDMEARVQGREGLRSASKVCDMFGALVFDDQDQDYSVPKGWVF